jgi:predicted SAM-dependent methyltransferase
VTEHPGAVTADIRPGAAERVEDVRSIGFEDGTLDGVELYHVLEHLFPDDAHRALSEIWRVLKPGGELAIAVPDMTLCAQAVLSGDMAILDNIYSPSEEPAQCHRWGYTEQTLRLALGGAGFVDIVRQPSHPDDPHEMRFRVVKRA